MAFGNNSSIPHFQPTRRVLVDNDIILLDFGARVNGYCADMTRMVFFGKPKPEWLAAYNAVLKAQTVALETLTTSRSGKIIDQSARDILSQSEFSTYPHSLGHGVGLDIHEAPRLTVHNDATLSEGMIVTVEPGTYIEGSYGIRIEDLVLLHKDKVEILSKSPKEIITL